MQIMKKYTLALLSLLPAGCLFSQGCVAIRNIASLSPDMVYNKPSSDKWLLQIANRYLEGSTSFRGKSSFTDTLVTNRIYTLNISVLRMLNKGWSLALNVPISTNSRRNAADHGGITTPMHTTRSFGLGDIRFSVYKWLFNGTHTNGNIQAGLGLKLPTGDEAYQDYFFRNDSTRVLAPVDPAIQLGDGGTGITAELGGFYSISRTIMLFAQSYYMISPRDQNGVSNLKGRTATQLDIKTTNQVTSVPDQYSLRGGARFDVDRFSFTAAVRYERVPARDLFGGNKGFRRAAAIASAEPGIIYKMNQAQAFASVAIPFDRRTFQSYTDKRTSEFTGKFTMTPAGLADYLIFFGIQIPF